LSVARSVGPFAIETGTPLLCKIPIKRVAESAATPADWRPIGLVLSSVNMSANVRCTAYDAL